jgi:hypothetical protein
VDAVVSLTPRAEDLARFPASPGLYMVRRSGLSGCDYIGQTGVTLRARLSMLRGAFAAEMPYRDPHTAGPGFWALLDSGAEGS